MERLKKEEMFWGYLFVIPTIAGLLILNIIPIFRTIYQSFFRTGDFGIGNVFVGFDNYVRMFNDTEVWQALGNTFVFAAVQVPFSVFIGLVLAVLLSKKIKFRSTFRTIFFLPIVVTPAAIAMIWAWLYNSHFGLINNFFNVNVNWISDPNIAMFSLAVIGIWGAVGNTVILFMAGLSEIPRDFYDAAKIDGASEVSQFFKITIPMISPTMFFVTVTGTIAALQMFNLVFMMIEISNPAFQNTQTIVYLFYRYAFTFSEWGYASTIIVLLIGVIGLITLLQLYAQKKWVHYN